MLIRKIRSPNRSFFRHQKEWRVRIDICTATPTATT